MGGGGETLVRNTINNPRPQFVREDNIGFKMAEDIQGYYDGLSDIPNPYMEVRPTVI